MKARVKAAAAPRAAVRFLANPAGGRGRVAERLDELRALAAGAGAPLALSRDAADLAAQARRAVAEGTERLLVAGGDGTVHHALQALAGSDCALGILPLGSGNDIASALGVPAELEAAAAQALAGPVRRVDLARAGDRYYAAVAGAGFDSVATETANRVRRLRGGAVYVWAVLHTLATFRPPGFEIRYQGGRFSGRAMMVVLANGPSFGGGMRIAPAARLDDGLLDLVIVRAVSRPTFLRVFPRVYRGAHLGHPAVIAASTPWAEIRTDRPLRVFGDGEPMGLAGEDPARFEVVPAALAAVVGSTYDAGAVPAGGRER